MTSLMKSDLILVVISSAYLFQVFINFSIYLKNHDVRIVLTGAKLGSNFNINDDTNKQHKYDLDYFSSRLSMTLTDSYIGETARCISKIVAGHAGRDLKSHIVRNCLNYDDDTVNIEHFKILSIGYNNNMYRRRILAASFAKIKY